MCSERYAYHNFIYGMEKFQIGLDLFWINVRKSYIFNKSQRLCSSIVSSSNFVWVIRKKEKLNFSFIYNGSIKYRAT